MSTGVVMSKRSAGLLAYRWGGGRLEVFLVHMGGPFWAGKDEGAWSIPKGEIRDGEDLLAAALREFKEETGFDPPRGEHLELTPRRSGDKLVHVWAFEGDFDPQSLVSNTFRMEWPPSSGRWSSFPEVDRGAWFSPQEAIRKIVKGQRGFVEELRRKLEG
jgi:predicted NUDIX family NTP pyrophosphohydrolase